MRRLARRLAELRFTLHSGGAAGADTAFEEGAIAGGGAHKIFLPWKNFSRHDSPLYTICETAVELAQYYHPQGKGMSPTVTKLMARNCYQVLGEDLKSPVDFIACWTPGGRAAGGTGQALRIAADRDIPVFNLYNTASLDRLAQHLSLLGVKGLKDVDRPVA
jgi:hypothetical protein